MSSIQVKSTLDRRPSFWKTPITRNHIVSGNKRNYSQINVEQKNKKNVQIFPNPNKKRRLLTESEITNIAKTGGFNPANIIIAVEETDGFCWFKTKQNNQNLVKEEYLQKYWNISTDKDTEKTSNGEIGKEQNVLRELTKDDLKERKIQKKENPNQANKQKVMQRLAKIRRHTAPIHVLQALIAQNDKKEKELLSKKGSNPKLKKKKKRRKKIKKVTVYETKKEIIRKKVIKKKRILKKKKYVHQNIKITTEFAEMCIPDFPVPNLKFSVLFASNLSRPFNAIRNFELALIESFVMPLAKVYGQEDEWSFITRNTLQYLMEIKGKISNYVNCIDFEAVTIPIQKSIVAYKECEQQNNKKSDKKSLNESPTLKLDKDRIKTAEIESEEALNGECVFYEHQLSQINAFCAQIESEIDFTKHGQQQLENDDYLQQIFDFDANEIEMSVDGDDNENAVTDDEFINQIASEIDKIYTEYCLDFRRIQYEQKRFEHQLNEREIEQFELAQYYKSNENEIAVVVNKESVKMDNRTKDRLILSNCIKANRDNDYLEDAMQNLHYLRHLNGYDMNEDDTMNMDIDVDMN